MSVISVPQAFNEDDLYVDLRSIFGRSLFLKCEGFNFAGSVKLKAAAEMVEAAADLGERYLETIYQTNWVEGIYGKDVLPHDFDVPVRASHQTVS